MVQHGANKRKRFVFAGMRSTFLSNTRRDLNVGLMLVQRRKPALVQGLYSVF